MRRPQLYFLVIIILASIATIIILSRRTVPVEQPASTTVVCKENTSQQQQQHPAPALPSKHVVAKKKKSREQKWSRLQHKVYYKGGASNGYICANEKWQLSYPQRQREDLEKLAKLYDQILERNGGKQCGDIPEDIAQQLPRLVMYRCSFERDQGQCGGHADRSLGIISAMFMALMFDRAFVMDYSKPSRLEDILEPNRIDWRFEQNQHFPLLSQYIRNLQNGCLRLPNGFKRDGRPMEAYNVAQMFSQWAFSREHRKRLRYYQIDTQLNALVQVMYTNSREWQLLMQNPHYIDRLHSLGVLRMPMKLVFGCMFPFLFKPSFHLLDQIEAFRTRHRLRSSLVVGIHVRTQVEIEGSDRPNDWSWTKNCAFALEKHRMPEQTARPVKWVLASDSSKLKANVASELPHLVVSYDYPASRNAGHNVEKGQIPHVDNVGQNQPAKYRAAVLMDTIAEWTLLTLADELVINRSGFGELASWISLKPRYKYDKDLSLRDNCSKPPQYETIVWFGAKPDEEYCKVPQDDDIILPPNALKWYAENLKSAAQAHLARRK